MSNAEYRKMIQHMNWEKTVDHGPRPAEIERLVKAYGHLGKDNLKRMRREQERITLFYTSKGSFVRVKAFEQINAIDILLKRRQSPRETAISELRRRVETLEAALAAVVTR